MTNAEDGHEERWRFSIFSGTRKVWRGQIANSSAAFAFQPYVLRGALFDLDPRSKFSLKWWLMSSGLRVKILCTAARHRTFTLSSSFEEGGTQGKSAMSWMVRLALVVTLLREMILCCLFLCGSWENFENFVRGDGSSFFPPHQKIF